MRSVNAKAPQTWPGPCQSCGNTASIVAGDPLLDNPHKRIGYCQRCGRQPFGLPDRKLPGLARVSTDYPRLRRAMVNRSFGKHEARRISLRGIGPKFSTRLDHRSGSCCLT
jgi:hypothetical protein